MTKNVEASRQFRGPWWVAVALLGIEPEELVAPVLSELHAPVTATSSVTHVVEVDCGPVRREAGQARMDVHWRDAGRSPGFPEMHGELRLMEVDDDVTELLLVGEYEPPFGALGRVGDAVAGHRVAQRTFDDAAARLAARFEEAVARRTGGTDSAS